MAAPEYRHIIARHYCVYMRVSLAGASLLPPVVWEGACVQFLIKVDSNDIISTVKWAVRRLMLRVLLAALSCVTLKVLVCVVFVCLFVAISAPILALLNS